ncbi:deoxyribodipyrimidine photolyase [Arcanobacterium pluranimalium]|uniref:hypothetical protein n=1 Tax=Arcanobacterium pluranimalium TaxID=108028 RepID=UPI00195C932C|nr:hypothetical protein [Arcanobacterium pluranimalium]MBM7825507.1 deoxyribodipyrimidine photolyase [Arcanobacterium pluranimalium]
MTVLVPVRASHIECEAVNSGIEYSCTHEQQLHVFLDFSALSCDEEYIGAKTEELTQKLRASGVDFYIESVLNDSDVVEKMASVVENSGTDVVIVNLKSKASQEKVQLGSQIQRILLEVPCSILVLRPSDNNRRE